MASIDTLVEQQKHAVALLVALFRMLPALATVVALYDIACVLDRSIQIYDLLDDDIVARLQLAAAVMHAYDHQWVCKPHYNPRMRIGLEIMDGECTERLWSRLHKMIRLERRASCARRAGIIDRQCDAIALDLREGIGKWITKQLEKNIQKKEADAVKELRKLGTAQGVLRRYWTASACVKKELSKFFQLHNQIDNLEEELTSVKSAVKQLPFPPADTIFRLHTLEERNLKLTIRRKATGSFFEWDRLDQAIGGVHEALGTRAHPVNSFVLFCANLLFDIGFVSKVTPPNAGTPLSREPSISPSKRSLKLKKGAHKSFIHVALEQAQLAATETAQSAAVGKHPSAEPSRPASASISATGSNISGYAHSPSPIPQLQPPHQRLHSTSPDPFGMPNPNPQQPPHHYAQPAGAGYLQSAAGHHPQYPVPPPQPEFIPCLHLSPNHYLSPPPDPQPSTTSPSPSGVTALETQGKLHPPPPVTTSTPLPSMVAEFQRESDSKANEGNTQTSKTHELPEPSGSQDTNKAVAGDKNVNEESDTLLGSERLPGLDEVKSQPYIGDNR
ncbi:hypothetical protein PM082_010147 [Marasmius tenuissimus]|nr:hypothetical protein PM082_010147 [Marasmius tenuissimus]